jgi:hypothetical protein
MVLLPQFLVLLFLAVVGPAWAGVEEMEAAFRKPPDDARVMMRWWWFGPAITDGEIERELRVMKEGGIGGVEIQPVYPVALDDEKTGIHTVPYLSGEFLARLKFAVRKARELGMRVDVTLGSGWPYGGPSVSVNEAAGRLRIERATVRGGTRRVALPYAGAGEQLIGVFAGGREITDLHDGAAWVPDAYQGEVLFFLSSRTGQMVKRAAVGAEGFVVDHYDRAAVEHYLKTVADPLMKACAPDAPYAVFCDSLEVYGSDWTGDFLEEFQKRRGYDLKPHLPALAGNRGEETAGLRHDWGLTLTELVNERFLKPVHEWARENHTLFRIQGYGIPPASISSYENADLPEGEGPQWKILRASRWASSASHLLGRKVASSETWTWLHSPSFRATPLDMKAEADLHFLQGINQLIGHGWPYTAPGAEYPGWRLYAAAVFDEKNPWWIVMPDVTRYLQRVSFLLRRGEPVNDVALYLPVADAYAEFRPGRPDLIGTLARRLGPDIVGRILEAGYNLDFFDDGTADRVVGGKYRAIVLPGVERIPVETLRKFEGFARRGGSVVATRRVPSGAPGYRAAAEENSAIKQIVKEMFDGAAAPGRFVENENQGLASALRATVRPDVSISPAAPDIGVVHRRTETAEIYFVANTSNQARRVKAEFRVNGMRAELWDPMTGAVTGTGGGAAVELELEPYGSRVVVFTKRSLRAQPRGTERVAADWSSGWTVRFEGLSKPVTMDKLRSWQVDEATRYYSGVATYEKEVRVSAEALRGGRLRLDFGSGTVVPEERLTNGMRAWLDGPVREAAVVYVNGRRAGSVWMPPYSVDVTGLLRGGSNQLRIEVSNTAINYMAGRQLPDYRLLNLRYGVRFEPQDMDKVRVLPSGLLGPVRLIAAGEGH